MKHRINIGDIVHHLGVAASTQRDYARDIGNKQLATQFTRQADQADNIASVFSDVENSDGLANFYIDGDELIVEVA